MSDLNIRKANENDIKGLVKLLYEELYLKI